MTNLPRKMKSQKIMLSQIPDSDDKSVEKNEIKNKCFKITV